MHSTYPNGGGPVKTEQQRGQTSPGLKTSNSGHMTSTYPGKGGNGFKLSNTSRNGPGTCTYAKSGQMQKKPGTNVENAVPGDITKASPSWNLMGKPKAK